MLSKIFKQVVPTVVAALAALSFACRPAETQAEIETRILDHIGTQLRSGEPVIVSDLANEVFTTPEERAALDRLYDTFFKVPLFLVQFQSSTGRTPSLREIADQFHLATDRQADILLSIMEADPRVPTFFQRDANSGELLDIDIEPIRAHPQFGQEIERSLSGWEGRPIPAFATETFDGETATSALVEDRPHMVYFWFTNCPPCVETSPLLVELYEEYAEDGFEIVAANADRLLGLPYDDEVRSEYLEQVGIRFPAVHLTEQMQRDYGGVTVFPTMFFANRQGIIVRHLVSFQERNVLEEAIHAAME